MTLSPLQLAAIVSAGVPGIYPIAATAAPEETADYDTAIITDSADRNWLVRAPRTPDASIRLEAEHQVLRAFGSGLRGRLPFSVPAVAGAVPYGSTSVFVYSYVPGTVYDIDGLAKISAAAGRDEDSLATELGHALATLHVMPEDIMIEANLPVYTSHSIRRRKRSELDRAEATGKIPPELAAHWRALLSPSALWEFRPRVVHGRLGAEHITLNENRKIAEIIGWSDIHLGDPAQDLSWLFSASDTTFTDNVIQVYSSQMPQVPDDHLVQRAEFYAEFAIAQWLTRGAERGDAEIIEHGVEMLMGILDNLRASGEILGQ